MPGLPAPASASASRSGPASALDADAAARLHRNMDRLLADCGEISASQEEFLARAPFLGGEEEDEEEEEVFSTPPLAQQDQQSQGQSQGGQAGAGDGMDGITICTMPFTQTQPSLSPPPASSSSSWNSEDSSSDGEEQEDQLASGPRMSRACARKVRGGGPKIDTPTPIPSPSSGPELDPLARIVLMIPTAPRPTTDHVDILELARSRGIFP